MNMFWVELILVLAIIFLGVRKGGTFLAMAGGVGMLIMTFFFHVTPADPPVTVILIMIAVIVCSSCNNAGMWGIGFPGSHSRKDSSQES